LFLVASFHATFLFLSHLHIYSIF